MAYFVQNWSLMTRRIAIAALACAPLFLSTPASAHRQFLVPSSTVVANSANGPWIGFDAAVANEIFFFDHVPLRLDGLTITAADGSIVKAENIGTGKFRNSFDLHTIVAGTYKVSVVNEGINARYKENGVAKSWRGTAEAFAKEVPANAEELVVTQSQGRVETFVTNGKPNTTALAPTNKGLELTPITHPNDLVAGEPASFRFLLDGKPAANVKVTVIAAGIRYRQKLDEQVFTTDSDGKVKITWQGAGMYWLGANVEDNKGSIAAAKVRRVAYYGTLEVLPQ